MKQIRIGPDLPLRIKDSDPAWTEGAKPKSALLSGVFHINRHEADLDWPICLKESKILTKNEINIIGYILFLIKLSGGDGITPAFIILYLLSRYIRNDAYRLFRPWKWLFENMFMKSCSSSRQQSTALS
jgi:hypothetical protein